MKYDCDLIRDITPLYKDGVLSDRGKEIVDEHLSECADCKKYYAEYSDETVSILETGDETKSEIAFAKKIKGYRIWQAGLFIFSLLTLRTMALPWFGYIGISDVEGTVVLSHPLAIIGLGLFFFAIWYHYRRISARILSGYVGWGLVLGMAIYDFLTLPMGSIMGIQIGFLRYEIPFFHDFSIAECFSNTLPAFYFFIATWLLAGILFFFFVNTLKHSKCTQNVNFTFFL